MTRLLFFASMLVAVTLQGQNPVVLPLNVWSSIQEGIVTVEHSQFDIGVLGNIFDGDEASLGRSAAINPMVITLTFRNSVTVSSTGILTSHGSGGWWTLESADNRSDLDNQTGTYARRVDQAQHFGDVWATVDFPASFSARLIRLTVQRLQGDDYVHLNEWAITATQAVQAAGLCFRPNALRLIPQAVFQMQAVLTDTAGFSYTLPNDPNWTSTDTELFSVSGNGLVTAGGEKGSAALRIDWNGLNKTIPVEVADDFQPIAAETRTVRIALVVIDPPIAAAGGERFSEHFWSYEGGPLYLAQTMADSLTAFSHGAVDYRIVQIYDSDSLFCDFGEVRLTADSIYQLFLEPGWATLHLVAEQLGQSHFDYNAMLAHYDFCTQSDAGLIDEIWVYSMPFIGTWESTLTGDGAFWYNSPPLTGNDCTDQLPIMGLNYERGLAEALHSYGHRTESALVQVFGRWQYTMPPLNNWELFAQYDLLTPGQAHMGNIHFPPNGTSDYDYANANSVITYASNWRRYPFLFQETNIVSCAAWDCDHLGYLSWWYRHIPYFRCKDQFNHLNNWWTYVVDYKEGRALEAQTPGCDCDFLGDSSLYVNEPVQALTVEVFPNPVGSVLQVRLSALKNQDVLIRLYNSWSVLLWEDRRVLAPGLQQFTLPADQWPAGHYWMHITTDRGPGHVIPFIRGGN